MAPTNKYHDVESKTRFIAVLLAYAVAVSFLACVAVVFVLRGGPGVTIFGIAASTVVVAVLGLGHLVGLFNE